MSDEKILEVIKDPGVFIEEVFGLKLLECQKVLIRQLHDKNNVDDALNTVSQRRITWLLIKLIGQMFQ